MKDKMPLLKEFAKTLGKFARELSEKSMQKVSIYAVKVRDKVRRIDAKKSLENFKTSSFLRSIKEFGKPDFSKSKFMSRRLYKIKSLGSKFSRINSAKFQGFKLLPKASLLRFGFSKFRQSSHDFRNKFKRFNLFKKPSPEPSSGSSLKPSFFTSILAEHLMNIAVIILPYSIVSYIIYPEFSWKQFLQEVFSLLCIYAAIFFWLSESASAVESSRAISRISRSLKYGLIIAVTACAAPMFFANNNFSVAFVEILLMIFAEFVLAKYIKGCSLFSNKIPVYLVCDTLDDFKMIEKGLQSKYKLLDSVILEDGDAEGIFRRLQKRLCNTNRLAFLPHPRRILYFSSAFSSSITAPYSYSQDNPCNSRLAANITPGDLIISRLLDISAQFSVPLFKLKYVGDAIRGDSFKLLPFSIADIDAVSILPQERAMILDVFKGKSVWIFYDGRKCVQDLVRAISDVANLTIFCASESLMREMEAEFGDNSQNDQHITQIKGRFSGNIHKIKIADKSALMSTDSKPEILFFNTPLLHLNSSEDNMKEAVVKNALDVSEIANAALKLNVKFVFFLSTMEAFETKNWIGATQRLGELYIQWISSRKSQTKFRVIRIPYCVTDPSGLFRKVEDAIKGDNAGIFGDFADFMDTDSSEMECSIECRDRSEDFSKGSPESSFEEGNHCYYDRDAIFHPFIKLIVHTLRDAYVLPDIYSIFPKCSPKSFEEVAGVACKLLGMRAKEDIGLSAARISGTFSSEVSENGEKSREWKRSNSSGSNAGRSKSRGRVSKKFEETSIDPAVVLTKAPATIKYKENLSLSLEDIGKMSTRDIISTVFQTLNMNEEKCQDSSNNSRSVSGSSSRFSSKSLSRSS